MSITVERLSAEIEADPSRAVAGLRAFDGMLDAVTRDRSIDIDLDLTGAATDVGTLTGLLDAATRDRTIHVDVDTDRSGRGGFGGSGSIGSLFGGMASAATAAGSAVADAASTAGQAAVSGFGAATNAAGALTDGLGNASSMANQATDAMGSLGGAMGGGGGLGKGGGAGGGAAAGAAALAGAVVGVIQGLGPLIIMGAAIGSILPGAFAAAATAAGVLVAAIGPLVGLLGAIPVALGGLVMLGGSLLAALGPVISGYSAYGDMLEGGAQAADDLAAKQHALVQANQAVVAATHQVIRAEEALKEAREDLRDAPHEAAEYLEDLHLSAAQAALNERKAILALQEAQENLAAAQEGAADAGMTLMKQTDEFTGKVYDVAYASSDAVKGANDQREAQLALQQAEIDLAEARDANSDAQRDLTEAERKGIKNSDIMVDARRKVRDAEWALAEAHQQVANAQFQQAQAQKALNEQISTGGTAMQAWQDALESLSPAGVEFIRFLHDDFIPGMKDLAKGVQEATLPGIQRGMTALMGVFDEIEGELAIVGGMLGDEIGDFFEYWTQPAQQKKLGSMFDSLNGAIGSMLDLARPLSRVLVGIIDAASPMVETIFEGIADELDRWADWMDTPKGGQAMRDFFDDAAYFAGLWWDVLKGVGGVLKAIARAGRPLAVEWLESMGTSLEEMGAYLNSPEGQTMLQDFFQESVPALQQLWELIEDVFDLLFNSSQGGTESGFYKAIVAVRDIIPEVKELFEDLDETNFMGQLVEAVGMLVDLFNQVPWKAISDTVDALIEFKEDWDGFMEDLEDIPILGDMIQNILSPVERLQNMFGILRGYVEGVGWLIEHIFGPLAGWFQEHVVDPVAEVLSPLLDPVIDAVNEAWRVMTSVWGGIEKWWDENVMGFFEDTDWGAVLKPLSDAFDEVFRVIVLTPLEAIVEAIQWIIDHVDEAVDALGDLEIPDLNPLNGGFDVTPWDGLVPGRWSGGSVQKDQTYMVGEHGPELFNPSTSGRIMPATPTREIMESTAPGIDPADLEHILERVLDRAKPDVTVEMTNEHPVDPHHLARELAWSL